MIKGLMVVVFALMIYVGGGDLDLLGYLFLALLVLLAADKVNEKRNA